MSVGFIRPKIGPTKRCCEQVNDPYIKVMEYLDRMVDHKLVKDPVPCSLFRMSVCVLFLNPRTIAGCIPLGWLAVFATVAAICNHKDIVPSRGGGRSSATLEWPNCWTAAKTFLVLFQKIRVNVRNIHDGNKEKAADNYVTWLWEVP